MLELDVALDVPVDSLGVSFADLLPYLFFKYLAHELNAAPSLSPERSGDGSRDFNACDDLLLDRSLDGEDNDEVPYLN